MRANLSLCNAILWASLVFCGSSLDLTSQEPRAYASSSVSAPTFNLTAGQNGAVVISLASATSGATIYYTVDGSTPTASSPGYFAPLLCASNFTVKAIAISSQNSSTVAAANFAPNIASGTLVWSAEFGNATGANAQPDPALWTYQAGNLIYGNQELVDYCAWGSASSPCEPSNPNPYVGPDGYLHIVAQQPFSGVYTSAWMDTHGMFSFQYGRVEARMKLPEDQGMWPGFWLLGNNMPSVSWPACGELDVMEHLDGNNPKNLGYDWVSGSVHGAGFDGTALYHPADFSAADWHTYGMIWSPGQIEYYVDSPANIYAVYTPASMGGTWPFDNGPQYLIFNLDVGGTWPGNPDASTVFPAQILVDYVRIYAN
jgi:beta-glucanase (GH16 family)